MVQLTQQSLVLLTAVLIIITISVLVPLWVMCFPFPTTFLLTKSAANRFSLHDYRAHVCTHTGVFLQAPTGAPMCQNSRTTLGLKAAPTCPVSLCLSRTCQDPGFPESLLGELQAPGNKMEQTSGIQTCFNTPPLLSRCSLYVSGRIWCE